MDGTYLKRAALLLFHPDPEQFFTGAYVKIGFFRTLSDLRFQDVISGYLFEQVEKTMDLLMSKYLEAQIRYEGISRIEEFPYPEAALREALLNAIAHKDYGSGNPIQIKVYNDRINFWNAGQLPDQLTRKDTGSLSLSGRRRHYGGVDVCRLAGVRHEPDLFTGFISDRTPYSSIKSSIIPFILSNREGR